MSITNTLPELPEGVTNPIVYCQDLDTGTYYYMFNPTSGNGTVNLNEDCQLTWDSGDYITGQYYELQNGTWALVRTGGGSNSSMFSLQNANGDLADVIFSSYALYQNGALVVPRAEISEYGTALPTIGNTITGATLLSGLISPFTILLPLVLGAVVVWLGFRKGWAWLKGNAKGA